ncbi:TRAP transporter substrate-binding protein DctP [Aquisalimonas lutea]|uniref:TRAP transporter substrate-binding protein DctP n=1 Tax=Aquisalimonas lutea TaxID=1327750 RepID=UPI0025B4EBD3|nr:TRAP transporter substrate-binding protein DctP [Aquisalimonas lutea]MDN3517230.1 TRAP transporter substrate-binding protein DctP [Aquisalimonas lutea]
MIKQTLQSAAGAVAIVALSLGSVSAQNLTISAGLAKHHFWVGAHMDEFADRVEENTDISFTRYYAGELVSIGGERDALDSGVIDVAAPLLAPYHEGQFPLSDITQLPTYGTDSEMVTRAFTALMDSDREITDGKTFYDYEIGDKDLKAWGLGATSAYVISTSGEELQEPDDFSGMPMRAGSALHTVVLEQLGVTPVTMPAAEAYGAMSRGTIDGIILSVGDWISYSLEELLTYTITDVAIGHWQSYIAMTEEQWNRLSEDQREHVDRIARDVTQANAQHIEEQDAQVREDAAAAGAEFVPVSELSEAMQNHIADAARQTWIDWIEDLESDGHPARETARLWAELIIEQGGELPDGVADYLDLDV